MKLKTVRVEFDFVLAVQNDEKCAKEKAQDYVENALRDMSKRDIDIELSDYAPGSVYGWDEDCIPYGGDGDTPTKDYVPNVELTGRVKSQD